VPVLPALGCLLLANCAGWQSVLDAHGAPAFSLKQLIILIVAICSLVWTLVMIALIAALCRGRGDANRPVGSTSESHMRNVVVTATALTVIVISGFTVASFFTTRSLSAAGNDDLIVRVRGSQWWWNVEYLDPQPDKRFATANEIHIPVGRNIRFQLEGDDVIHSFWCRAFPASRISFPGGPTN
jgi:cytochrome c oxidase subunit 2